MVDWDDHQLTAALRRRADALDVGDIDVAATSVRRRAGRQRAFRVGATVLSFAVVAIAGVVAIRSLDGGQEVVRSPATPPPPVVTTVPPASTTPAPSTVTASPTTVIGTVTPTPPTTVTFGRRAGFGSLGGGITVEKVGDRIRLVGQPEPAEGYAFEVEDNGPNRVRVRFDNGERRSRITVELVDGAWVPRVDEE